MNNLFDKAKYINQLILDLDIVKEHQLIEANQHIIEQLKTELNGLTDMQKKLVQNFYSDDTDSNLISIYEKEKEQKLNHPLFSNYNYTIEEINDLIKQIQTIIKTSLQ